jgi:hypothetical protein
MFLALIFLPVALVMITVGLPLLILVVSIGVVGVVMYQNICTKLSGKTLAQSSIYETSYQYDYNYNHGLRSRSLSPTPILALVSGYPLSSSLSFSQQRYQYSESETPPSPRSSMHDIGIDDLHREKKIGVAQRGRKTVRFA